MAESTVIEECRNVSVRLLPLPILVDSHVVVPHLSQTPSHTPLLLPQQSASLAKAETLSVNYSRAHHY